MRPEIYKKFDDLDSQLADMTTNQGDITQLNTTDKSSVVNAIKEVKTATNSILSKMVDWINVKSAPYNAKGDGVADDTTAIQNAINDCSSAGGGTVYVPRGIYKCGKILLKAKVIIRGAGMMSTQFDFSLSPDDGFLVSGGVGNFMHGAGLFDLRGYNAPASGFHVLNTVGGGLGEGFYVDRVQMNNNGQYGFLFNGDSTPLHLGHLSCHGNVVSGVGLVSENESHVQIEYVAGDNNGDSLIIIMSTGISTSINIMGWKSERWGSTPGNPNIFHVVNANGGYLQIGPGRYTSQVATQPNAIIHIESGSNLNLKIEPISSASNLTVDYLYGINWVALTKTSTATALKLHSYTNVPALTL